MKCIPQTDNKIAVKLCHSSKFPVTVKKIKKNFHCISLRNDVNCSINHIYVVRHHLIMESCSNE